MQTPHTALHRTVLVIHNWIGPLVAAAVRLQLCWVLKILAWRQGAGVCYTRQRGTVLAHEHMVALVAHRIVLRSMPCAGWHASQQLSTGT
jgi:hypothetical protein